MGGAGYTDVHVRLPAIELLAVVALAVFVLMVFNVYQRSLALPAIGAGLWVLVALAAGVIVPAAVQALHVTPAQSTLELPYITRNISATHAGDGAWTGITTQKFAGTANLTGAVVAGDTSTLDNLPLWEPSITSQIYQKLQQNGTGFTLAGLSLDRYPIDGSPDPVRDRCSPGQCRGPADPVVGQHPPPVHPRLRRDAVAGEPADRRQPELRHLGRATRLEQRRPADQPAGGLLRCRPDGLRRRRHEAERGRLFGHERQHGLQPLRRDRRHTDRLVLGQGRLRPPLPRPQPAHLGSDHAELALAHACRTSGPGSPRSAPFLSVDNNPYPVIDNGQIDWIVDAYTTTSYYPYAQQAQTSELPSGSGLTGSPFNYVRNSVKVVVNAYTGDMTFYAVTNRDPILNTWEATFPGMFQPLSDMDSVLQGALALPAGPAHGAGDDVRPLPPDQRLRPSTRPATPGSSHRRPAPGRRSRRCRPMPSGTSCVSFPSTRSCNCPSKPTRASPSSSPWTRSAERRRSRSSPPCITASCNYRELRGADRLPDADEGAAERPGHRQLGRSSRTPRSPST